MCVHTTSFLPPNCSTKCSAPSILHELKRKIKVHFLFLCQMRGVLAGSTLSSPAERPLCYTESNSKQQQLFKYKRICIGESRPPSDEPPPYTSVRGEKTCWWKIKTDNHNTKFHSFLFYAAAVYYRRCRLVGYIGGEGITIEMYIVMYIYSYKSREPIKIYTETESNLKRQVIQTIPGITNIIIIIVHPYCINMFVVPGSNFVIYSIINR